MNHNGKNDSGFEWIGDQNESDIEKLPEALLKAYKLFVNTILLYFLYVKGISHSMLFVLSVLSSDFF